MKRMKYEVGDKVRIRSWDSMASQYGTDSRDGSINVRHSFTKPMGKYCGKLVTIAELRPSFNGYKIEEDGGAWTYSDEMFETTSSTIIIYRNDDEVIALDKSTGKMNKAICSPEDEFDFYTGASLAITRLINDEPVPEVRKTEKYFTGEIFCTSGAGFFEKGRIYKVKKGYILRKDGTIFGAGRGVGPYKSIEEINEDFLSKFIEVVR